MNTFFNSQHDTLLLKMLKTISVSWFAFLFLPPLIFNLFLLKKFLKVFKDLSPLIEKKKKKSQISY